jgi:sn-glycerol 3-phosphate transport system permease protein
MVERRPALGILAHAVLIIGVLIVAFPIYIAFVASTHTAEDIVQVPMPMLPGVHLLDNYRDALVGGTVGAGSKASVGRMMWISLMMALMITIGKISISLLSAFAIVYFRFRFRQFFFWAIFVTLMLPVEVRILPTYEAVTNVALPLQWLFDWLGIEVSLEWNMMNSYGGLILPLIASATATFLFRQFFLTVPDELVEAARMDGAGPMRFFRDVLLPLSKTSMAALFVIQFIYGWNQYLWPLLVTTDERMYPIVMGIKRLIFGEVYVEWNVVMATAILAMLPPAIVVMLMQKWFVKGLVDTEK